jgi:hypothetical protein
MLHYVGVGVVLVLLLGAGAYAVWYVWASRQNPKVIEIVGGSILITLLLGSSSTLFAKLRAEPKSHKVAVTLWFLISASLLMIVIAGLVFSSNTPPSIKKEIPVTYLIDMNDLAIVSDLEVESAEARFLYMDAVALFQHFKGASDDNQRQVKSALAEPGRWLHFGTGLFCDLTEILIPRCIAGPGEQGDSEPAVWRGEVRRWNAWPDKRIAAENVDINDILGPLSQNQFFHIQGSPLYELDRNNHNMELRLPRNARICLSSGDAPWSSAYTISNDFVEIKIRVQVFLLGIWLRLTYPAESAFRVSLTPSNRRRGPFYRVDTVIYYEATFSKRWYSLSKMRYHEEWANDLLALLERRFTWGSPPLLDFAEVMKQNKKRIEQ